MSQKTISYKEVILINNKTNEHFVEKKNIYISGNDLVCGSTAKTKNKVDGCLVWTENELRLLEKTTDFKVKKDYERVNLECVKDKNAQVLFVSNLSPRKQQRIFSAHWGNFSRKIGLLPKLNSVVTNIEKLQTWGNKVEMVDRIVATFYDICNEIWRRSRASESLKSGIKNTSGGIKAGENDQPEEL